MPKKQNDLVTDVSVFSTIHNASPVEMHVAHTLDTDGLLVAGMGEEAPGGRMFIEYIR